MYALCSRPVESFALYCVYSSPSPIVSRFIEYTSPMPVYVSAESGNDISITAVSAASVILYFFMLLLLEPVICKIMSALDCLINYIIKC